MQQPMDTGTSHKLLEKNEDVYLYKSIYRPIFLILRVCD